MKKSTPLYVVLFSCILLITMIFALTIGAAQISFLETYKILFSQLGFDVDLGEISQNQVLTVMVLRLPRIIMSVLAGAALAACGVVFQAVFRNPICDPYILGISSGASLGAAIAFTCGWNFIAFGVTLPALVTALLTLAVIVGLQKIAKQKGTNTLLLAGIAINFLISALITLLIVMNQQEMQKIIFWSMGSLASVGWRDLLFFVPLFLIGTFFLFFYVKPLNIIQLGGETAQGLGVNTQRTISWSLVFSSLLIAGVVSLCGVIGFIGLIIPHVVRIMFGNQLRHVLLYSLFIGALFLLLADTLSRTLIANSELPVGSITAMVGAPYFIYLLLKSRNNVTL